MRADNKIILIIIFYHVANNKYMYYECMCEYAVQNKYKNV